MILLTGGAGFIGSNILKGLNDRGLSDILVVDNLKNAAKHLNLNARQFSDFIEKEKLPEILPKLTNIEAIIHQGACSTTTETDGQYMMRNNYEYSKTILRHCLSNKIPLIYASSAAVYGNGERGFDDRHDDFFPLNIYAYSKLLFDRYVRKILQNKSNPSPVIGLRYFNVFGAQENHKGDMASVPYKLYRQKQAGQSISIFKGSERFFRDFVYIEDVVAIVLYFLDKTISGIFNAGTGLARSFKDIAEVYKTRFAELMINEIPFPAHLVGKYQEYTQADLTQLRNTGYTQPFHTLEAGISKYLSQLEATEGYWKE
jgi:ADP-L-glycero-D-manno-heptose 6-epimerase